MTAKECKELRQALGLTQAMLAATLGVAVGTVSRWENGRATPSHLAARNLGALRRAGEELKDGQ